MSLALIAGNGDLPRQIIQECCRKASPLHVIGFEGQTDPLLAKEEGIKSYAEFSLGAIGGILDYLRSNQITEVVFAGGVRRPGWSELQLDWMGAKWLKSLSWRALKGDNDLLEGILQLMKEEGFLIIKPADIIENLFASKGVLTRNQPTKQDWQDIKRGIEVLHALAPVDVGQAAIVQQGIILGIEAVEGTASLIQRAGLLRRQGEGGSLIKLVKKQQDHRIDLPTIGTETLRQTAEAGLKGIAISAGTTQVIHYAETIRLADKFGIFIVGIEDV